MLTCLHQNNFGLDDFLGNVVLPLNEMDVYDIPRPKWYPLKNKPGKENNKNRGELELRIGFTVKEGTASDLSKKESHKSSLGQITSSSSTKTGSLLSINTLEKRKNLKKFAKSLGSKMHITGKKDKRKAGGDDSGSISGSISGSVSNMFGTPTMNSRKPLHARGQNVDEADPGVVSEGDDEFTFENLSHKSSGSSLNIQNGAHKNGLSQSKGPTNDVDLPYSTSSIDNGSDSLKRRSWEINTRTPLAIPQEEEEEAHQRLHNSLRKASQGSLNMPKTVPEIRASPQAPATSEESVASPKMKHDRQVVPQALPRITSLESVAEKRLNKEKAKADKDNKLTNKFRAFGFGRNIVDQDDGSKSAKMKQYNPTISSEYFRITAQNQSDGERVIVGHENERHNLGGGELPKAVLQRYEGKTKEVCNGVRSVDNL